MSASLQVATNEIFMTEKQELFKLAIIPVRYAFINWSLNTVTSLILHFCFLIFSLYK